MESVRNHPRRDHLFTEIIKMTASYWKTGKEFHIIFESYDNIRI